VLVALTHATLAIAAILAAEEDDADGRTDPKAPRAGSSGPGRFLLYRSDE
jgi:hypothetical protein